MKHDMPRPVTRSSSKQELWDELMCARREIDTQNSDICGMRAERKKDAERWHALREENLGMGKVITVIKAVLA